MTTRLLLRVAGSTTLLLTLTVLGACTSHSAQPVVAPSSGAVSTVTSGAAASTGNTSSPRSDVIATSKGELKITPIYHATTLFQFGGKSYYVDPWSKGDYTGLPKADVIFISDIHPDHLDQAALDRIKQPSTIVVGPPAVAEKTHVDVVLKNGESKEVAEVGVEAIPMYNLKRGPAPGQLFHDKGRGDGFVLTFGDKRVYLSGDTECTDEMKALKSIDIAFVCMNLPYTMTPAEAAVCIDAFKPKILYPYHYRDSNLSELKSALAKDPGIEIRERKWY